VLTQAGTLLVALGKGTALGLHFNVIVAAATSALAAGLSGHRRAGRAGLAWSAGVLLCGWLVGEGLRLAGLASTGAVIAGWALAGLGFGYVLPTVTGAYVGRLVHKGTGYLSAAMVAATIVPALASIGATVGGLLQRALA
jgi:hypothetical protein